MSEVVDIMIVIKSSRFYRASKNKSRILAAYQNPINRELIQQVEDAVTCVYDVDDDDSESAESIALDDRVLDDDGESAISDETELESAVPEVGHSDEYADDESDVDDDVSADNDLSSDDESSVNGSDSAIKSYCSIESSRSLDTNCLVDQSISFIDDDVCSNTTQERMVDLDAIVNLLNNDASTSGVRDIYRDETGVWIYYTDETNLNSVMDNVISSIRSIYPSLQFNRLARMHNAIVFTSKDD